MGQKSCEKIGFGGNAKRLFKKMQPDPGRTFMTLADFDTKSYNAIQKGDFRSLLEEDEPSEKTKKHEMTFMERSDDSNWHKVRKSWEMAQREQFAKATRNTEPFSSDAHQLPDKADEFHVLCQRKYGSVISAWRRLLDQEQTGRLSFNEFCQACRRLGYSGDLRKL